LCSPRGCFILIKIKIFATLQFSEFPEDSSPRVRNFREKPSQEYGR